MSHATQIRSFAVPVALWAEGCPELATLPKLALVARDALAIERRARKGVNLRNEQRRYTLCCERIQGIMIELAGRCQQSVEVWTWPAESEQGAPRAMAYLAVAEVLIPWMRKHLMGEPNPVPHYLRFPFLFFPPEDLEPYLAQFRIIDRHPEREWLFAQAAQFMLAQDAEAALSPQECQAAFKARLRWIERAHTVRAGLVDVMEYV